MKKKSSDQSKQQPAEVHHVHQHYQGALFSFVSEDVTLPNGSRTELAKVHHPGSTAVVPLSDDYMVIMERQYRHAVGEYLLEIPAGTMEPGEAPLDCAKRELEEETGFVADEFVELSQILIIPAYSDEKIFVYLAQGLKKSRQKLDQDEIIEVVEHPFDEALKMTGNGRITDALTVLALQMVWFYLHRRFIK
jgi:ADP-ribose pyrophosphatase